MIHHKYFAPATVLEWIRNLNKSSQNISVIWKETILSFNLIGNGLAWRVGDGHSLQVGIDPSIGRVVMIYYQIIRLGTYRLEDCSLLIMLGI